MLNFDCRLTREFRLFLDTKSESIFIPVGTISNKETLSINIYKFCHGGFLKVRVISSNLPCEKFSYIAVRF